MSVHVFTYGSLMFPEVWQRVVRGSYRFAPARADGFARFAIMNETYPGMIAQERASVAGVLYFDVRPGDVAALDAFEGDEYRRATVRVTLDGGAMADAQTYLYLRQEKLSEMPWEPDAFQMERFIDTYCRDRLGE